MRLSWLALLPCLLALLPTASADVYQTPEDFLREEQANPASAESLWLNGEIKKPVEQILGHPYNALRVKYWRSQGKTLWILEDIGKDEYITFGFVIANQSIELARVLEFRESRGWEIKFPSFTRQFTGAKLDPGLGLDREVDGITGATLSVNAFDRMARLALLLDKNVEKNAP
ncbi:MAG: FMN-binding protein [Halothiobacillaceae bacterium]|jgi:hypothetical protein|nr:FMN-binding protein [Halothiobacillaceae bacterium]MDY0049161.1 FMN-binding protein [Halothiobacillaceae bacterium]